MIAHEWGPWDIVGTEFVSGAPMAGRQCQFHGCMGNELVVIQTACPARVKPTNEPHCLPGFLCDDCARRPALIIIAIAALTLAILLLLITRG